MIRRIIQIDADKCNGCGLCATACHEGAISMIDGKATLLRDDYCDGLGDCLPACPTGAITFVEREAAEYNGVGSPDRPGANQHQSETLPCGCPGTHAKKLERPVSPAACDAPQTANDNAPSPSELGQWPCQIKLVPVNAPYFNGAKLLVAADCAAYAYGRFHHDFMRGKITLIGCPKLDDADYAEKLTAILKNNDIKSVTVARMEVPCCGGLEHAVKTALQNCGKMLPWQVVTISTNGDLLDA